MPTFKPGDLVKLRSGGPPMTVVAIQGKGSSAAQARCCWFECSDGGNQAMREASFPCKALTLEDAAKGTQLAPPEDDGAMGDILARSMERQQQMAQDKLAPPAGTRWFSRKRSTKRDPSR
jgi:uncharacterized protein YodC (DUF2158 family)